MSVIHENRNWYKLRSKWKWIKEVTRICVLVKKVREGDKWNLSLCNTRIKKKELRVTTNDLFDARNMFTLDSFTTCSYSRPVFRGFNAGNSLLVSSIFTFLFFIRTHFPPSRSGGDTGIFSFDQNSWKFTIRKSNCDSQGQKCSSVPLLSSFSRSSWRGKGARQNGREILPAESVRRKCLTFSRLRRLMMKFVEFVREEWIPNLVNKSWFHYCEMFPLLESKLH